jgi:two-component system alkaline phosphatase synthesis response regulator PhoP
VVEDDPSMCALLTFLLQRQGYVVTVASDGRQMFTLVDSTAPPALVVLDMMLPYRAGLEVIAHMRARESWAAVPIVVLSAQTDEESVVCALEAGAADYVVKPFRPEELVARVRRAVRAPRAS